MPSFRKAAHRINGVYSAPKVQMSDEQHGTMTSFSGAEFLVDPVACTCTCERYQINNIPCGHAVACIVKLQKEPCDYIPGIFSLQEYLQTYNRNVLPVNTTELEVSLHCRPPTLNRPRGRPKERRIRKEEKQRKRFQQQTTGFLGDITSCIRHFSGCGKTGYNITICREPPKLIVIGL